MTKVEIANEVCRRHGNITKSEAQLAVDKIFNIIKEELINENEVEIRSFGSFKIHRRATRKGRNLKTGEIVPIPPRTVTTFRPCQSLKQRINF